MSCSMFPKQFGNKQAHGVFPLINSCHKTIDYLKIFVLG